MEIKDLFDPKDFNAFLHRISKIEAGTKPLWGKMNSAQAMAHLAEPFLLALGDLKPGMELRGKLYGWMLKFMVTDPKPYPKNAPTGKDFIFPSHVDFEQSKSKLIHLLTRFHKGGPEKVTDGPHPFFGKLTPAQWNSAMAKHLDHHLSQFGV
jgi:hypothetical protein